MFFAAEMGIACQWVATTEHERADYVELVPHRNANNKITPRHGHGHLKGNQILEKIREPIDFPSATGGLRMIMCERHRYSPLDFPLQKATYDEIVSKFQLSDKTLQVFDCDAGTFSRSNCYDGSGKLTGINIVIKAPQKKESGNYALSMHYNIETCVTTALLYGTDMLVCGEDDKHKIATVNRMQGHSQLAEPAVGRPEPHLAETYNVAPAVKDKVFFSYISDPSARQGRKEHCQFRPEFQRLIEGDAFTNVMKHPLALPCAILENHLRLTQSFCEHGVVFQENWEIMNKLGMRGEGADQSIFWIDAMEAKTDEDESGADKSFDAKKLTARIDRQILRILFAEKGPQWNRECSEFLLDLATDLRGDATMKKLKAGYSFDEDHCEVLQQELRHNVAIAHSLMSRLEVMRENMNVQLNVCASITGQALNESNMRIALQTAQDSTSMKILAFITALFLPASFVATMFGMNLFDDIWLDDKGHWWIYVAVTVPLTFIVMGGWAAWWRIEINLKKKNMRFQSVSSWKDYKDRRSQAASGAKGSNPSAGAGTATAGGQKSTTSPPPAPKETV